MNRRPRNRSVRRLQFRTQTLLGGVFYPEKSQECWFSREKDRKPLRRSDLRRSLFPEMNHAQKRRSPNDSKAARLLPDVLMGTVPFAAVSDGAKAKSGYRDHLRARKHRGGRSHTNPKRKRGPRKGKLLCGPRLRFGLVCSSSIGLGLEERRRPATACPVRVEGTGLRITRNGWRTDRLPS